MNSSASRTSMRALAGLAVVGALTLTACNDNASSDATKSAAPTAAAPAPTSAAPTTPAAAPTTAAPSTPAAAPTASAPAAGGAPGTDAAAGTAAKIGDTLQVPFSSGSTKGTITLTVTSIEAGTQADLDSLKLGDKAKGLMPYYIHYKFTNVGATDLSYSSLTKIRGLLPDGSGAQDVALFGSFPKCSGKSLPAGFTNGQSAEGCTVSLAPAASKVAGAEYWSEPYTLGKGVVWK
ncbi:hypothetical protein PUR71_39710 [Streptomyces sp. SP17BM10]|uniref:hypothetical protein n=1 Tax=Streptomyces sp. SP17BM10 TaxID=3002530 RepID=UPI002E78B09C|nr:hypothetical protein [Streptomyces sp. SP17BM10]MEE1788985.1 hypothetical protein [Streptomyces sp. SP17BM10]